MKSLWPSCQQAEGRFLPLLNRNRSDSRINGKLWCSINFRPENSCFSTPSNRSRMALLRHNKYEKRRSFSFDFIAFSPRCLRLPWRRMAETMILLFYCNESVLTSSSSRETFMLRHAKNGSSVPTLNVQPCHVKQWSTLKRIHRASIFPQFGCKGFSFPSSNRVGRRFKKRSKATKQTHFVHEKFMRNDVP